MKRYSAVVKEVKYGNRIVLIRNQEYNTKKDFIRDLEGNGYKVNQRKVKQSDVFDYILNHTNCSPEDWKISEVPANI